jgi:hypothetical protein
MLSSQILLFTHSADRCVSFPIGSKIASFLTVIQILLASVSMNRLSRSKPIVTDQFLKIVGTFQRAAECDEQRYAQTKLPVLRTAMSPRAKKCRYKVPSIGVRGLSFLETEATLHVIQSPNKQSWLWVTKDLAQFSNNFQALHYRHVAWWVHVWLCNLFVREHILPKLQESHNASSLFLWWWRTPPPPENNQLFDGGNVKDRQQIVNIRDIGANRMKFVLKLAELGDRCSAT